MAENKQLSAANNIRFLHGTQASLNSVISNSKGIPGTFYFTTDSHRMYLAQADSTIVPVNDSIIKVAKVEDLPTTNVYGDGSLGSFYYATKENVLCVYNGTSWVQINPDTFIDSRALTMTQATNSNVITIQDEIKNNTNTTHDTQWSLAGDETISVELKKENDKYKIQLHVNTQLKTKASTDTGIIVLANSDTDTQPQTITITGNNSIKVASDDQGNIVIDGSELSAGSAEVDIKSIEHSVDGYGVFTTTLTRNNNNKFSDTFKPVISYGKGSTPAKAVFAKDTSNSSDPADGIAHLDIYTATEIDQILEDNFKTFNAMSYIGTTKDDASVKTVSSTNLTFYPTDVKIGDTYKVAQDNRYTQTGKYCSSGTLPTGEKWARIGDLLIANGEESSGTILADNIKWDWVESGDDVNNIYSATLQNYGFTIKEQAEGNDVEILNFNLEAGTNITLGTDKPTTGEETDKTRTVTINHATITTTNVGAPTGNPDNSHTQESADVTDYTTTTDFSYIESITTDNGHTTNVTTKKFRLVDTNASVKEVKVTPTVSDNKQNATLTTKVTLQHPSSTNAANDYKEGTVNIKSLNDNLQMTIDETALAFNLVWGTF